MEQDDIIKIIKKKDNWDSKELIKTIKEKDKKQVKIKFCYIGGYECLKDGTQTEICKSLKEVQDLLEDIEIDFDKNIKDPIELAKSIESEWIERYNDGGGSGWIEF